MTEQEITEKAEKELHEYVTSTGGGRETNHSGMCQSCGEIVEFSEISTHAKECEYIRRDVNVESK